MDVHPRTEAGGGGSAHCPWRPPTSTDKRKRAELPLPASTDVHRRTEASGTISARCPQHPHVSSSERILNPSTSSHFASLPRPNGKARSGGSAVGPLVGSGVAPSWAGAGIPSAPGPQDPPGLPSGRDHKTRPASGVAGVPASSPIRLGLRLGESRIARPNQDPHGRVGEPATSTRAPRPATSPPTTAPLGAAAGQGVPTAGASLPRE
jgi:hypothetical protein